MIQPQSEILEIANMNKTSGFWYSWGPKEYMEQWVSASSAVMAHSLSMKEGAYSHQGPGLYLASAAWRSSTYAKAESRLLIAILNEVPTIDISNNAQKTALGNMGIDFDALYNKDNLVEMLLIYSTAGTFGRLTANATLTLDLNQVPPGVLKSDYKKFASVAREPFANQAQECGLDIAGW